MPNSSESLDMKKHVVVAESSSGAHVRDADVGSQRDVGPENNGTLTSSAEPSALGEWQQERRGKMVDISIEAIKQQITLATVIIGALLTFVEKINAADRQNLPFALVPLALTIVFGIVALQSIAYHIEDSSGPFNKPTVRFAGIAQNISFIVAVVGMVIIIWS